MITYKNGQSSGRKAVVYDTFLSLDASKAPANVARYHSPNTVNMIRDEYGKVRRRMGYFPAMTLTGKIWGVSKYSGDFIVHAGTKLYKVTFTGTTQVHTELFASMAEALSRFYVYKNILYVMDGTNYLSYDGTTCASVAGKTPLVAIGGVGGERTWNNTYDEYEPNTTGSSVGTLYEQFNMLSDAWQQSYSVGANNYYFPLLFAHASTKPVIVSYLNGSEWVDYEQGQWYVNNSTDALITKAAYDAKTPAEQSFYVTYFNVNGTSIFLNGHPPSASVGGADSVKITAYKDRSTERAKILGCTMMMPFGIGGDENMLFVSGNAAYSNQVYWSAVDDPTYFGDLQYAYLGQDTSAISGLSSLDTGLLCHKDGVSGAHYLLTLGLELVNGLYVPQTTVSKVISGTGCMAPYSCQGFGEPLFLSPLGIQAITYRELTIREVVTTRGDRINRKLLAETGVAGALSCVYKYFYLVAINEHVYVLDRLNPMAEDGTLNNSAQYNAFYWEHVPVSCWYTDQDKLFFGTADGNVMQFYTDESSADSYADDGEAYDWSWEFPEYVGELFYQNKGIKYLALRAKAYQQTSVTIDVQLNGTWYQVLQDSTSFGYLDLSDLNLNNLNLSSDQTPKKTTEKLNQQRLDKFAFRIRGNTPGEPFGLYSFAFEIKEHGKHKG